MSHNVRIKDTLWPLLAAEAARRVTTPSRLVDLAVRRDLGLEPNVHMTVQPAEEVQGKEPVDGEIA